jgi:chromosomal replication initiator protein
MKRRMKEQAYTTWMQGTRGEPGHNGDFKVEVPNQFVADWINSHYSEIINEAFQEVLGKHYSVNYVLTGQADPEEQTTFDFEADQEDPHPVAEATRGNGTGGHNINSRYSFHNLVVGDFNQFACAASTAVAEEPGTGRYNPLYIYGGTGLGKTHIAQAIGNHVLEQYPRKRVYYATSELFTNDFITAISDRSINEFTRKYRNVDVLIIDDIQFFTGKESTQEQFFHTFNTLYHTGKQIVLTSDRPPKEIKGLEERLLSRFSWGLVTDLQAPDLENRTAILYKKLDSVGKKLPDDAIRFIADHVSTNVRELEGALTRVLAYASHMGVPVDMEVTRKVLSDIMPSRPANLTISDIQTKTAETFDVDPDMMKAKKKTAHIALARQVAMYLARSLTDKSLKAIGSAFGGRDHSTVIHACDLVERRMADNSEFRERVERLSGSLLW